MFGTIVNTCCIVAGSVVGSLLHRGLGEKYQETLFNAMGLASLVLGVNVFVSNIGHSDFPVLFILSLAIGGLLGTWLDINGRVGAWGAGDGKSFAQGLTTACLLYCIGTLSIVGPVLSAVNGDNTFLYTNATLDFVSSLIFAATYGIRMAWGAVVLFCWQGSIYGVARLLSGYDLLAGPLMNEVSSVGGVLILCSGLSLLKLKDCHTLNLLPSLMVPVVFYMVKYLL